MRRALTLGTLLLIGGMTMVVAAQQPAARATLPDLQKVKDNLYIIAASSPVDRSQFTGGNTGVFVTDTGVVVVDTKLAGYGPDILAKIRKVTDKPVTTIINTHTHGDHTGSNEGFPATVDIVAHENTKANMAKMDAFKGDKAQFLPKRTYKDKLSLGSGKDRDRPVLLRRRPHQRRHVGRLSGAARAADRRHVRVEGRAALDRANGGSGVEFPKTLAKAIATIKDVDTVIPGHSPVMAPKDLQEYQRYTADLLSADRGGEEGRQERRRCRRVDQPHREVSGLQVRSREGGRRGDLRGARREIASGMRRGPVAWILLLAGGAVAAQTPPHAHPIPSVPQELVTRAVPHRTGIGRAHDAVGTTSPEAQSFYDQGLAYLHGYQWIEAARSFNQALRADAQLAVAQIGLTYAYTELNQPAMARTALDRAQTLAARANAHDRLHIDARAAQMAAEAAPNDRALLAVYRKSLDAALVKAPADAELWMLRGIAESPDPADRGQGSPISSMPFYEKAIALGGVSAHHYLTHALENANRVTEALPHADAYARLAPTLPHALHMNGHVLRRAGRIDEAIGAFEAADRAETEYFRREGVAPEYEWHYEHNLDLLASSYRYVGQLQNAERRFKTAFDLPSSLVVQMYNKRAWPDFLTSRGRVDEAIAAATVLVGHQVALVRATGYIEVGLAQVAAGRFQAAAEASNKALAEMRASSDGQALVAPALRELQGSFLLRTGQGERGKTMLRDLVRDLRARTGPDNWAQALFTLEAIAKTARDAGDWPFADWAARQMLEHDPNYAGGHYALALVAEHDGNAAAARVSFEAARRFWARADVSMPEFLRSSGQSPARRIP